MLNRFRIRPGPRARRVLRCLAALTRHIVAEHDISPRRIYVAGLSAGAAMAVVLGQAYPELYAAVGAHSGPSAWSGIGHVRGIRRDGARAHRRRHRHVAVAPRYRRSSLHGDADKTVHPANAGAIVANALRIAVRRSRDDRNR